MAFIAGFPDWPVEPPGDASLRLEVSRRGFLQNGLIEFRIGQQAFQPDVLFFEILEPLRLIHSQAAVHLSPAAVGLFGHADLVADLANRSAAEQFNPRLAKFRNNPLRHVTLPSRHNLPPIFYTQNSPDYRTKHGLVSGGMVRLRRPFSLTVEPLQIRIATRVMRYGCMVDDSTRHGYPMG